MARGLRAVPSGPVHFASTPARPVGGPGWYLTRPGFAWGGIGVAACWYGGARALADRLGAIAAKRGGELMHLAVGRVDVGLLAARLALTDAARTVDAGRAEGAAGEVLALRVRSVVAAAAEQTLTLVGHALGPAPLAFDETYARRTADLELYIRQHHAERDLAALGRRAGRAGNRRSVSVGFDHLELGTPESAWRGRRPAGRPGRPQTSHQRWRPSGQVARFLVVAAHPDDESLGAGGLIATAGGRRVRPYMSSSPRTVTRPIPTRPPTPPPSWSGSAATRCALPSPRLAPSARLTLLDLPDGRLAEHEHELADVIAANLVDATLLVTPWRERPPPGSRGVRAGRCGRRQSRCAGRDRRALAVPDLAVALGRSGRPRSALVDAIGFLDLDPAARRAKARAVACHRSQHEPLSDRPGDEAILPPRLLEHFARPFETFVVAAETDVDG